MNLNLAKLYNLQGRPQDALDRLESAVDEGLTFPVWNMVHPDFDPLREDPRFQALKRRTLKLEDG